MQNKSQYADERHTLQIAVQTNDTRTNTVFGEERLTRIKRGSYQIARASGHLCECPCEREIPVPDDQHAPRNFSQVLVNCPGSPEEACGDHCPSLESLSTRRKDV